MCLTDNPYKTVNIIAPRVLDQFTNNVTNNKICKYSAKGNKILRDSQFPVSVNGFQVTRFSQVAVILLCQFCLGMEPILLEWSWPSQDVH